MEAFKLTNFGEKYSLERDFAFDGFEAASKLDAVAWKDDFYTKLAEVGVAANTCTSFKKIYLPGMLT